MKLRAAPELVASEWINCRNPVTLASLQPKTVMICVFQMLCRGCVAHALPQARRVHETFAGDDFVLIGLHSVFEHHEANSSAALKAFAHEYRLDFPIAIDSPSPGGPIPRTMSAYRIQGTPTHVLIDRRGRVRKQKFGHETDLRLGAEIMSLILEPAD